MARVRIQIMVCAAAILVLAGSAFANESIYKQVLPATAWIITPSGKGSGVLVDMDRKLVATNYHVVGLHSEVTVVFPKFNDQNVVVEKDYYEKNLRLGIKAKVKVRDPRRDLALIELEEVPDGATALELAPRGSAPGQTVHAIGNPGASGALWVYSTGSIRQVYTKRFVTDSGLVIESRVVETQTPMNPGDSGGPVVNEAGQLVALTCAFKPNSSLFGLCIEVSELKALLQGKIKSIDRELGNALRALKLKYTISIVGDYVVEVPLRNGGRQFVVVGSVTWPRGPLSMREVYSTVPVPTKGLSAGMTIRLLKQTDGLIFGSWKCIFVDGKEYLVYRTMVPASGEPETLRGAFYETIGVTVNARRELAAMEAQQKLPTQDRL